MRAPIEQTRIVIMQMAMLGYILYEYETGEIGTTKTYDAIRPEQGALITMSSASIANKQTQCGAKFGNP